MQWNKRQNKEREKNCKKDMVLSNKYNGSLGDPTNSQSGH